MNMAQGDSHKYPSNGNNNTNSNWNSNQQSKKTGFEAIQKEEREKNKKNNGNDNNRYGAWGPIFKNKEHFSSMHNH